MNVEIAQRLAARRKQAGLSQESLAEKLGVSRQAVSKWERSESSPDTDNLIALAHLYGLSLDDLLYVDDDMEDDVKFEAADRAAERVGKEESSAPTGDPGSQGGYGKTGEAAAPDDADDKKRVHIGLDGIHVLDGDDYVHVSWHDGVHVRDAKKGEEVHVGWEGVHVTDGSSFQDDNREGKRKKHDGERVVVTGDGISGQDGKGNEFVVDGTGAWVKGADSDGWKDACSHHRHHSSNDEWWNRPSGYTVKGEWFETLEEAREKYGSGIPVCHHRLRRFERSWARFPYPLVVVLAYLLLGIFENTWGVGLFLFFTIPAYYMIGHAIGRRRIAPFVAGMYPLGVTAWFCYSAFILNAWHPAWVVFLTIPLVEWLVHSLARWWRVRSRAASQNDTSEPIDVKPE